MLMHASKYRACDVRAASATPTSAATIRGRSYCSELASTAATIRGAATIRCPNDIVQDVIM